MQSKIISLSKPLVFGDAKIEQLTLRRPSAGDLRGIKVQGIIDMDVNTILALLPRISLTPLAPSTVADIDPADLVSVCEALSGFFVASSSPFLTTP